MPSCLSTSILRGSGATDCLCLHRGTSCGAVADHRLGAACSPEPVSFLQGVQATFWNSAPSAPDQPPHRAREATLGENLAVIPRYIHNPRLRQPFLPFHSCVYETSISHDQAYLASIRDYHSTAAESSINDDPSWTDGLSAALSWSSSLDARLRLCSGVFGRPEGGDK